MEYLLWKGVWTCHTTDCGLSEWHDVVGHAPTTIILAIFVCEANVFPLLCELTKKIVLYFIVEKICEMNWFESVNLLIWNINVTA